VLLLSVGSSFARGDTLDFRVKTDAGKSKQNYPAIAASGQGRTVAVWQDYRSGNNYDIYVQLFDSSGIKIEGKVRL